MEYVTGQDGIYRRFKDPKRGVPLFTAHLYRNEVTPKLLSMSSRQRAEPVLDEVEPTSRRGRRPNPMVDTAIRTATLELISEVGYAHVTFEAVAARGWGQSQCYLPAVALAGRSRLRRRKRARRRAVATSPKHRDSGRRPERAPHADRAPF